MFCVFSVDYIGIAEYTILMSRVLKHLGAVGRRDNSSPIPFGSNGHRCLAIQTPPDSEGKFLIMLIYSQA